MASGFVKDGSRLKHSFKTADMAAYEAAMAYSMRLYHLDEKQYTQYAFELKAPPDRCAKPASIASISCAIQTAFCSLL